MVIGRHDKSDVNVETRVPLAAVAAASVVLLKQRRRVLAGVCRRCGSDLRATPWRCPEYGMMPPATPAR
jgi:hypothetical protein